MKQTGRQNQDKKAAWTTTFQPCQSHPTPPYTHTDNQLPLPGPLFPVVGQDPPRSGQTPGDREFSYLQRASQDSREPKSHGPNCTAPEAGLNRALVAGLQAGTGRGTTEGGVGGIHVLFFESSGLPTL